MEEQYIRGVNQELIRTLKKILEKIGNSSGSEGSSQLIVDKLDDISTSITEGLSTLHTDISELKDISLKQNYLNPTHLGIVSEGDTTFEQNVVLCNITDNNITVTVIAADDTTAQSIVLTPGWNPVIIKSISGATANTLIYGY